MNNEYIARIRQLAERGQQVLSATSIQPFRQPQPEDDRTIYAIIEPSQTAHLKIGEMMQSLVSLLRARDAKASIVTLAFGPYVTLTRTYYPRATFPGRFTTTTADHAPVTQATRGIPLVQFNRVIFDGEELLLAATRVPPVLKKMRRLLLEANAKINATSQTGEHDPFAITLLQLHELDPNHFAELKEQVRQMDSQIQARPLSMAFESGIGYFFGTRKR
jgi:hypothetical protein